MKKNNFERMIDLAENSFNHSKNNDQIVVNEITMKKLNAIHPNTLSEYEKGDGPLAWVIIIPTTKDLMHRFLKNDINERQLLENIVINDNYNVLYLCSAMVLEEYRNKGIAKKLSLDSINSMRKDHQIESLFVWPFSQNGQKLAENISKLSNLPLLKKNNFYI